MDSQQHNRVEIFLAGDVGMCCHQAWRLQVQPIDSGTALGCQRRGKSRELIVCLSPRGPARPVVGLLASGGALVDVGFVRAGSQRQRGRKLLHSFEMIRANEIAILGTIQVSPPDPRQLGHRGLLTKGGRLYGVAFFAPDASCLTQKATP